MYNESFERLVILYAALVTSLHSCFVHPCHNGDALSTPAMSTLATSCWFVHSCKFHPCNMVPNCLLLHCPPLPYRADVSTPAFSTPPFLTVPLCPLPQIPSTQCVVFWGSRDHARLTSWQLSISFLVWYSLYSSLFHLKHQFLLSNVPNADTDAHRHVGQFRVVRIPQGGPHSRRPVCGLLELPIWCMFNSFSLSISVLADY